MLAGQVRQLADRQLARALEGAGDRALARARLPASAVVAVQRLDLHLKVAGGCGQRGTRRRLGRRLRGRPGPPAGHHRPGRCRRRRPRGVVRRRLGRRTSPPGAPRSPGCRRRLVGARSRRGRGQRQILRPLTPPRSKPSPSCGAGSRATRPAPSAPWPELARGDARVATLLVADEATALTRALLPRCSPAPTPRFAAQAGPPRAGPTLTRSRRLTRHDAR
jgi:hypothetical protein